MGLRADLHEILVECLGSRKVYFQPPETIKLSYPCIIYELDSINTTYAGDKPYLHDRRYSVMIIDKNPDSEIPDKIGDLKTASFSRHYTADNLHHFVYNLYY